MESVALSPELLQIGRDRPSNSSDHRRLPMVHCVSFRLRRAGSPDATASSPVDQLVSDGTTLNTAQAPGANEGLLVRLHHGVLARRHLARHLRGAVRRGLRGRRRAGRHRRRPPHASGPSATRVADRRAPIGPRRPPPHPDPPEASPCGAPTALDDDRSSCERSDGIRRGEPTASVVRLRPRSRRRPIRAADRVGARPAHDNVHAVAPDRPDVDPRSAQASLAFTA
jgi:hypothetical protein